jgi:hypothetical protein
MSNALLDELRKPEYASLSDQAAADAINAKTVTVRVLVDLWQIEEYARRNGIRQSLRRAEGNAQHPCQGIAIDILAYITSPRTEKLDVDLPETQEMFGAMVSCGFATEANVGEMLALANETKRWVDVNNVGNQSADSVRVARDILNGATAKRDGWKRIIADDYNAKYAMIDNWKSGDPDPVL